AIQTLDEMGLSDIRMRDALLRASGASDVFTEALQTGNDAWNENTALTNEAKQRYETLESKLGILRNTATDLGISLYDSLENPLRGAVDTATDMVGSL
ncbi:phage tail tape measure protein, partial [Pseudomonas aeruginosa]